jgi:BASS family bile acid:Na+ symporter
MGNRTFALFGSMGGYIAGLILMPAIALVFLGESIVQPLKLLTIIFELILVPVILSRIILWKQWEKPLYPVKGPITNWCFFIVTYTIVGLNRELIWNHPLDLIPVVAIAVLSIVVLGLSIRYVAKCIHFDPKDSVALMFLGILKNYGIAGGIALTLFSTKAALPSTISVIVMVLYIIALQLRARKKLPSENMLR